LKFYLKKGLNFSANTEIVNYLGKENGDAFSSPLWASIDDFKIFNRALGQHEVYNEMSRN